MNLISQSRTLRPTPSLRLRPNEKSLTSLKYWGQKHFVQMTTISFGNPYRKVNIKRQGLKTGLGRG